MPATVDDAPPTPCPSDRQNGDGTLRGGISAAPAGWYPDLVGSVRPHHSAGPDPVRPAQPANGFVTLDIIEQILKVDHR